MSGICGIFSWQNEQEAIQNNFARMVTAIRHRGRATQTIFYANKIAIGHGATTTQTTWYEDGNLCVALDGAIFNKNDLLCHKQHKAGSEAAIAAAFVSKAEQFPEQLDGHFGLAVWDKQKQELWLARDGLGVKPLYYCHLPEQGMLLFGSEARAVLAHPAITPQLNEDALSTFLSFGLIPSPLSIFEGIHKVFPGEVIKIDAQGQLSKRRFWAVPPYRPVFDDLATWGTAVREQVITSVSKKITANQTYGVFLSGGLDSTLIVAILKILGITNIYTFTLDFHPAVKKGHQMEDFYWAREVARQFSTKHHEFLFDRNHNPMELLPCIIEQFDEPTITPNAYSKYFLAKMAREQGIKLCLSGSGGEIHFERPLPKKWRKLQKIMQTNSTAETVRALRTRLFTPEIQQKLLQNPVDAWQIGLEATQHFVRSVQTDVPVERIAATSFRMLIADKGVFVQDRLAAINNIDIGYPLYDARLLDFMSHVPNSYKGFGNAAMWKAIMLKAFEKDLPKGVLEREIIGYPSYYWNNGEIELMKQHYLSPTALKRTGLFKPETVQQVLATDSLSKRKSAGKQTWGLMMIQAWYEQFIQSGSYV